ncbi:MAG: hypothetical protein IJO97_05150 [Lachnospiraceae bacterium]|nr:hypothetical protein [Lachnospiraceae bacterium]
MIERKDEMLTKETEKQLDVDLWIIVIASLLALMIVMIGNDWIYSIAENTSINVVLRVFWMGLFQFGVAGLGITIVAIIRKESFLSHGLRLKGIIPAVLLSVVCCLPDFIYNFAAGNVHTWCPFYDVNSTREVLASGFPYNVLGMLITAVCWGFFEGFNYVFISDKINARYPSKNKFLNWGAIVCAVMCILIHGAVGVTPDAIIEMLCTMFLIYGMLMVRDKTGNAWGCVLIFVVYWNAL